VLKRSLRPVAMVGALAVAATGLVLSMTPASAAGVVGKATLSNSTGPTLTGNIDTILWLSSSGPCAAPATKVRAVAKGFGFPDAGQIMYAPQTVGFSTTEPLHLLPVSNTFRIYAQNNGATPLVGAYDVRVQCVNSIGNLIYDEYQLTMNWSTPGNSYANIDQATFTVEPTEFTVKGAPALTSAPKVGVRVGATAGTFTPAPTGLTYQWLRGGAPIAGATTSSYTPSATDVGKALSVRVTASKSNLPSVSATSAARTVAAGTLVAKKAPSITGTAKVGKKLTAVKGTWSPAPASYSYQWQRGGKNISKATKSVYKLTKKDKGKKVRVKVTVKKAGYATAVKYSATKKIK
jgi:hypothetical protein